MPATMVSFTQLMLVFSRTICLAKYAILRKQTFVTILYGILCTGDLWGVLEFADINFTLRMIWFADVVDDSFATVILHRSKKKLK